MIPATRGPAKARGRKTIPSSCLGMKQIIEKTWGIHRNRAFFAIQPADPERCHGEAYGYPHSFKTMGNPYIPASHLQQ